MIDWDAWRLCYPETSFADQQAFYAKVAEEHPDQRCFHAGWVNSFLDMAAPRYVDEVGGWDGELAALALPEFLGIDSWWNYEIAPNVTPRETKRYQHITLTDWPWNGRLEGDALVLSHVVEHMLLRQLAELLEASACEWVYLDVPVSPEGQDWAGYWGTHILDGGWDDLEEILAGAGFRMAEHYDVTAASYGR